MYRSKVLLARAGFDGTLELLSAAWEKVLGYARHEFGGKTLCQLTASDKPAAVVAAILDSENMAPVELTVRCRDGRPKRLRLHRRFDGEERKMFIVAEEAQEAEQRGPTSTAAR
jgi:PAS domain-containing protein